MRNEQAFCRFEHLVFDDMSICDKKKVQFYQVSSRSSLVQWLSGKSVARPGYGWYKPFGWLRGSSVHGWVAGWKYIHGDVFRIPKQINLLCAIIGCGFQILTLTLATFLLAMVGTFSPTSRGAIVASSIIMYALTASISGYVAGYYYKMFGGTHWVRNVLLTSSLFSGPMVVTFAFLNTTAIAYRSTQALPFGTIVVIIFLWALVTFPLTVLGGIMAKNATVRYYPWRMPFA
jgi:hypothetical protein